MNKKQYDVPKKSYAFRFPAVEIDKAKKNAAKEGMNLTKFLENVIIAVNRQYEHSENS